MTSKIHRGGVPIPVVSFYSIQGGVGKSTIARKFAELITRAASHPNVLLVDLDVGAQGLTYRIMGGAATSGGTAHEAIASENANAAQAHNVTASISITAADSRRGQLYLLPAAPPNETRLLQTITELESEAIVNTMRAIIDGIVNKYAIACVVIDCSPGSESRYSAAAAALADVPVLVGRNEPATYEQIHVQAERYRELYSEFHPAKQKVVINQVSVREYFEERAKRHAISDWIPLTGEVIHETEGLSNRDSLQMLLFENYVIDLIKKFLIGHDGLIPEAHDVMPQEWLQMLAVLSRIDEAPRMKRLHLARRFVLPGGICLLVLGAIALGLRDSTWLEGQNERIGSVAIVSCVIGGVMAILGLYGASELSRLHVHIRKINSVGANGVFQMLRESPSKRKALEELRRICESLPPPAVQGRATNP